MWCKIKVYQQKLGFKTGGSAPLQNQGPHAMRLALLMLLQSTADTGWLPGWIFFYHQPLLCCIRTWAAPSSWLSTIPTPDWLIRGGCRSVTGPFILCLAGSLLSPEDKNLYWTKKKNLLDLVVAALLRCLTTTLSLSAVSGLPQPLVIQSVLHIMEQRRQKPWGQLVDLVSSKLTSLYRSKITWSGLFDATKRISA